ncbi:MAG: Regulatory protein RecX [Candidatus Woesebacteria bacterium GW2011_GWE2_31_6]|nr:MAG: Regulatory protein RecX [Candidatus Woesebacteria bacterium GW2011_GWE2_31_6]
MPTITAFKPQKNQKRVNIYIDGEFGFGLDLENFLKLGLKLNQELTTLEIEEIIKKAEFQKTFDKLLRFVIVRPRSEKEIKDYLKRKKVHESLNEELFNRLNRLELINDTKFSKWWVDQRLVFKNKSKKDLKFEVLNMSKYASRPKTLGSKLKQLPSKLIKERSIELNFRMP